MNSCVDCRHFVTVRRARFARCKLGMLMYVKRNRLIDKLYRIIWPGNRGTWLYTRGKHMAGLRACKMFEGMK